MHALTHAPTNLDTPTDRQAFELPQLDPGGFDPTQGDDRRIEHPIINHPTHASGISSNIIAAWQASAAGEGWRS